jgi:hypothetical protein
MDYIRVPKNMKKATIVRTVCVSDDHFMGRKQDPGVDYD